MTFVWDRSRVYGFPLLDTFVTRSNSDTRHPWLMMNFKFEFSKMDLYSMVQCSA